MRKKLLLFATVLISLMGFTTMAQVTTNPLPTKWEEIVGINAAGFKVYVDKNSLSRTEARPNGPDISEGGFLFVPEAGIMQFKNKKGEIVSALSLARYLTVDCKIGIMIPRMDYYFDTRTPTRNTKPVGVLEYTNALSIDILPIDSVLFKTLCPNYI